MSASSRVSGRRSNPIRGITYTDGRQRRLVAAGNATELQQRSVIDRPLTVEATFSLA
ncbi:hypothetical protein HC028_17280 [Planosporangium flavigriseum]|uniref:hypothetical protein n=1 Tax=Planosporangium flavigriseum TaxID=373681 RepID=UPI00143B05F5|nr:hypothetical protein [Planosporangium flavigriseum]NJC66243.1 hypothetical protein [Planosporangium flavigriseum]